MHSAGLTATALTAKPRAPLLARLSEQSVYKQFDAYRDVDWDTPANRIDHEDPRWEWPANDPLGATQWYREQPAGVRARLGLHMYATFMKIGVQFESVLQRGLLAFAQTLPNGAPEFRYAYHELIEEGQHSLMFQEFINRAGVDVTGLPTLVLRRARQIADFGRTFPELFFLCVLSGEDPIDHMQRTWLSGEREAHPLLKRIMQIHVAEEARHLCFARHYLRQRVPRLSSVRKWILGKRIAPTLALMASFMTRPSRQVVHTYRIPQAVLAEAYTRNPCQRARVVGSLRKVADLCREVGLLDPTSTWLWKKLGILEVRR